ncbi:MAG: hypothetical protein K2X74_13430 [Acetobacteraceae bacterium]|nr:hypothetical protein [Acetobacteraceae bacterium]
MRQGVLLAGGLAALLALGAAPGQAQPIPAPGGLTTGHLAELCAAGQGSDIVAAAAVGYCRGFMVGVGQFHAEAAGTHRSRPAIFCLPEPSPSFEQAAASFVTWVRANPDQAGNKAVVGLLHWARATHPCPTPPVGRGNRR